MAIDMKRLGMQIINRNKARTGKRPTSQAARVRRMLSRMNKIKRDARYVKKKIEGYKKAPKKITKKTGLFNQRQVTSYKRPQKTTDILKGMPIGKPRTAVLWAKYIPKKPPMFSLPWFGPSGYDEAKETPDADEILITPDAWGKDKFQYGEDIDATNEQKELFEEAEEMKGTPENLGEMIPKIELPDFGKMFGDMGKYALLAIAGIAAIMLLGRRK